MMISPIFVLRVNPIFSLGVKHLTIFLDSVVPHEIAIFD